MPGPIALLAGAAALGVILSAVSKRNPPRNGPTDGTIASGKPYLPAEAFALITDTTFLNPEALQLVGATAFTDRYAEIGMAKLLRYKATSVENRLLPGGGGQVKVIRANLAYRKAIGADGLPRLIDDTALGALRGGVGAAIASRGLATVPNGIPVDSLLFRTVMDDLRLFPDTVTVVAGDPAVLRTLATGVVTATNTALGVGPDVAVIATNLPLVSGELPTTTQELLNSMAET